MNCRHWGPPRSWQHLEVFLECIYPTSVMMFTWYEYTLDSLDSLDSLKLLRNSRQSISKCSFRILRNRCWRCAVVNHLSTCSVLCWDVMQKRDSMMVIWSSLSPAPFSHWSKLAVNNLRDSAFMSFSGNSSLSSTLIYQFHCLDA